MVQKQRAKQLVPINHQLIQDCKMACIVVTSIKPFKKGGKTVKKPLILHSNSGLQSEVAK